VASCRRTQGRYGAWRGSSRPADHGGVDLTDRSVTYTGPTILWRLRHPEGQVIRATFIPGSPVSTLVYFLDDRFERGENFEEWETALQQAQQLKEELLADGWKEEA
jgi:hypothetical protein